MGSFFKKNEIVVAEETPSVQEDLSAVLGNVRTFPRSVGKSFKEAVPFDVHNIAHRASYSYYLDNLKWGTDAPRFIKEEAYISLQAMISAKLLAYYMGKDKALIQLRVTDNGPVA